MPSRDMMERQRLIAEMAQQDIAWTIHDDRDNLANWWPQTAQEEFDDGYGDGWRNAVEEVTRVELVALTAALRDGRAAFFARLRRTGLLRDEPAANRSCAEFERFMFGPYGGGVQGDYATGYIRAFETFAAFVHSVH